MDHIRLLNQVRSEKNIRLACKYAFYDRCKNDDYFDHFELEYFKEFQERLIEEIRLELQQPEKFQVRPAYTYYTAKDNLCYRRMIYIPFKDLVIRYAYIIILANYFDKSLSKNCFANRRATGKQAENSLLEDFYKVSMPNFIEWQEKCANHYDVLIRTDISSFYDSISHQYLIDNLCNYLSTYRDTDFINIFYKLLCPDIISYSHKTNKVQQKQTLLQGITIGNNLEGFLANLYLKDIDEVMQDKDIEFGRYSDDMRIFAKNSETAHRYLLILQEHLLNKGLNLNASKTKIAKNKEEMEEIKSRIYKSLSIDSYDTFPENQDSDYSNFVYNNEVEKNIDIKENSNLYFSDFDPDSQIKEEEDAKKFCIYLSKRINTKDRTIKHIIQLENILTNFQRRGKHASWLLVESIYNKYIPTNTKEKAMEVLFKIFHDNTVIFYTRYRLLHHLVNLNYDINGNKLIKTIERQSELFDIILIFLKKPSFPLNLTALYALRELGYSRNKIENSYLSYLPIPLSDPILNAISYMQELDG